MARAQLAGFNLQQVISRAAQLQAALAEPDYKRRLARRERVACSDCAYAAVATGQFIPSASNALRAYPNGKVRVQSKGPLLGVDGRRSIPDPINLS